MNKVSFLTLGCKVNQYETEAMQELFKKRGYEICNENDICDVYVINTCTVTNLSDRKSRQFISRAKKLNKDAILAVVGCYSQVAPDEISAIEDVDVIIGTKNRARIVELCEESKKSNLKFNIVSELTKDCGFDVLSIENQESKTRAYIKIQEGCNMFCTYCIIPYARGPIKSRPIDDIYEEAVKLANNGYKEVIITGIHVGSYGLDLGNDTRLIDVIEKLSTIENLDRIRLSSIEAGIISKDFLIRLNPSDLQVSVRYTSFGTEHIYSAPWTYMLSFSGFCLAICSVHLVLIGKIYQLKGRRFSLFFSWLSVFVVLIAFMLLYNIVNIAGRN